MRKMQESKLEISFIYKVDAYEMFANLFEIFTFWLSRVYARN